MDVFERTLGEARKPSIEDGRLSKEHLEDLRRSGLTDETIKQAGLATVPAEAAQSYLGYPPPDRTASSSSTSGPAPTTG